MSPANPAKCHPLGPRVQGEESGKPLTLSGPGRRRGRDGAGQSCWPSIWAGALAPEEVSKALAKSPVLTAANIDPNEAATFIGGILGLRLDIEWGTPIHGRLLIEFPQQPDLLVQVAKPLLLEILAKRGVHVAALAQWTVSSRSKAIVLFEGDMSSSGLRRVASILSGPAGPWTSRPPRDSTPESVTGQASQLYFQAVTGYPDDLFGGNVQAQSLYQVNVWVERYAHKIEDLNKQNVNQDVLSYAGNVVMLLNEIGSNVQGCQMRSDLREATIGRPRE